MLGSTGNRMIREEVSANDLSDKEYLTLKVVRHSQDLEIHFRVKRTTMVGISLRVSVLWTVFSVFLSADD